MAHPFQRFGDPFESSELIVHEVIDTGASLYDRLSMLEKEFPERAKELNDEMKEQRKNKSETAKVRKANVDRTRSTLANQRASRWKKGKRRAKKPRELQSINTQAMGTSV